MLPCLNRRGGQSEHGDGIIPEKQLHFQNITLLGIHQVYQHAHTHTHPQAHRLAADEWRNHNVSNRSTNYLTSRNNNIIHSSRNSNSNRILMLAQAAARPRSARPGGPGPPRRPGPAAWRAGEVPCYRENSPAVEGSPIL